MVLSRIIILRPYHVSAFRGIPIVGGHRRFVRQALKLDLTNSLIDPHPHNILKRRPVLPLVTTNILHHICPMNTVQTGPLYMASSSSSSSSSYETDITDRLPHNPENTSDLSDDEIAFLEETFGKSLHDSSALTQQLVQELPTMKPSLIIKLKQAQSDANETARTVALSLSAIMDAQLAEAKDILQSLLSAGEIRKMDALIGKAAREGKLDAAFFTVLTMNLQTAQAEEATSPRASPQPPIIDDDAQQPLQPAAASRAQILQHVYTRCQEEVEKNVPPGIALLNKLLRTQVDSIRANQLEHYLCPQPNTITSPDGKVIELQGEPRVLVEPALLVDAIAKAVKQIRTVEQAGGTDRASAANMVEACRQVAKEARFVIGKQYGVESETLREFEEGLQPVFRPDSPESPYIKGE